MSQNHLDNEQFFQLPPVILKPKKEKAILNHHHWIFSGAVQKLPNFEDGSILPVSSSEGVLLGSAYFNKKSGIIGRMISFDKTPPLLAIESRLDAALEMRQQFFDRSRTNAYRLVNGEGDSLPGLVIDLYDNVVVLQCSTLGMEYLKETICDYLERKLKPEAIYERSNLPSRKEEGLKDQQGLLRGNLPKKVTVKENGLFFEIQVENAQKTGFFLDHREMRQYVRTISQGKSVLNAFSYTGGFSVYCLAGGATRVDSVDISKDAIETAKKNVSINGFPVEQQGFYADDVFQFLREKELNYQVVILDPPAFAKRQKDVIQACRGYKDINRLAMKKMPSKSILITCSCSHYVDERLFQQVIFQAACEAQRAVKIIGRHHLAIDHPINIFHPEGDYLKSLVLYID